MCREVGCYYVEYEQYYGDVVSDCVLMCLFTQMVVDGSPLVKNVSPVYVYVNLLSSTETTSASYIIIYKNAVIKSKQNVICFIVHRGFTFLYKTLSIYIQPKMVRNE